MTADVELSVTVSRDALGLGPLEIATSPDYYIGTQFLGAPVQWERQQTTSVWLDGAVTVNRHRQMVTEQIAVEVTGPDLPSVQASINALIRAFLQDSFVLTVVADGAVLVYACECADYQDASWTTPRLSGAQGQIMLSVPRQPMPIPAPPPPVVVPAVILSASATGTGRFGGGSHTGAFTFAAAATGTGRFGGSAAATTSGGARVVGVTEPVAANTGLNGSTGGTRTARSTDLICAANTTYTDIDVTGHIVLAPGCTVRRCTATGRKTGGTYYSSIFWGVNAAGALVEDCVARPTAATARVSLNGFGWSGAGYTVRWCDVSGVTDYFHGTGPDMTIEANYGHDYRFDADDPDQSGGWCHPDGIQLLGGARLRAVGNAFHMNYDPVLSNLAAELNADPWYAGKWGGGFGNCITLTLKNQAVTDFLIADGWLYGGEVGVQMPAQGAGFDTGNYGTIRGMRVSWVTANAWHGGAQKHHFRQDSGTGVIAIPPAGSPNVYLDSAKAGQVLPGTYQPLSVKTASTGP